MLLFWEHFCLLKPRLHSSLVKGIVLTGACFEQISMKSDAHSHTGGPASTLEWKYVSSGKGIHMHSCGRAIAAVSMPTSLLFCQPHLAGPFFLMLQNRELGKESTCPSFSTLCQLFMSQAVIGAFHDVLLMSNMLAAVYYASCRTWRSGVWYQQFCSVCAPLSFWESWQPWNDTLNSEH